jgi:hypothetical protein
MLRVSGLHADELGVPEGRGVVWDADANLAVSEVYNTLQFVTPLLELPIDEVTPQERRDYLSFRDEYTRLWRRYFDPVGVRLSLGEKQVKLETYILPLIQSSEYNAMRELVGGTTVKLDLAEIPPATLLQFAGSLSPNWRDWFLPREAFGDRFLFRWQDSPVYRKMIEAWVRQELEGPSDTLVRRQGQLFCQLPFTFGVKVGEKKAFKGLLGQVEKLAHDYAEGDLERLKPYRGATVSRYSCGPRGPAAQQLNGRDTPVEKRFLPVVYYATIDGVWYASFREESIRELIDLSADRREGKRGRKETDPLNTSFRFEPGAAPRATAVLGAYVEWQAHRRALTGAPMWYALYRAGVLPADADAKQRDEAALHYFGYVPISPDGAAYRYRAAFDDVINERHGSFGEPRLHGRLAEESPVARLLKQWGNLRADLRFREDGIHTVLTLERNPKK